LPPAPAGETQLSVLAVALATFGIIGVGANELISYPYWCIEKGYARFTGKIDQSEEWGERARGWMRVMRWDAWCSMVVYTFATIAFYLLGAAILGRIGLHPKGTDMIRTLGVMYEPVFGSIARWIFLFGAIAVLYSTFFVATASLARVVTDGLRVLGVGPRTEAGYRRGIQVMSVLFPFMCVAAYTMWSQPVMLVLIGGVMQGVMLPMLAGAALYFRYKRADSRITPGMAWDAFLWLSAIGMLITGLWTVWAKLEPYLKSLLESGS
jgi:Mn2+/Fe2+ NRAMP family transporter